MNSEKTYLRVIAALIVAVIMAACASMGRPEGGPRDEDPPIFLGSTPAPGALNVKTNKITIRFNENVQITDPLTKVVISPAQVTAPLITASGKNIVVELRDTLIPNTTYTVDFSDAIKDLNEGNIIDGFSFDFSTGPYIDTLQISGMVLQASNLEPAQGMIVGVYSNLADSAISTLPLERITKTNQLGQFTIRNLKEGTYRLFALKDNNRDWHWDRSEDVAFMDVTVSPEVSNLTVIDTLKTADESDSIVERIAAVYSPNDVLLTWFNEDYKAQYMLRNDRVDRNRLSFLFNAPSDTFPEITIANGIYEGKNLTDYAILNSAATRDTLEYWLTDSVLIMQDSLLVSARYLRTDTNDNLSWTTDTLKMFIRSAAKKNNDSKKKKKGEENEEPEINFLNFRSSSNGLEVYQELKFSASQPIVSIDMSKIKLEEKVDTDWVELEPPVFVCRDSLKPLVYIAEYDWIPGSRYKLTIDSAAVVGVYGEWNKTTMSEFTVRDEEEYSALDFTISGVNGPAFVQLLAQSDQPVFSEPVVDGHAVFKHLLPKVYYARLIVDSDSNGVYTEGSLTLNRQPEEVYYYPKKINIRKKWNVEQTWNVTELPLDQQKPYDIKKNKPKTNGAVADKPDDEEEDEDDFMMPGSAVDRLNNPRNSSRRTGNSRLRQNGSNRQAF
ncbi:MAG: Ig-like domain-containing protein [Paramuribaculum sp.]|nr:Ig-like domain-containing protein [Paramuribaculum sp.]